ncbi:MAG: hypothetical protein CM1200mP14_14760 [Gammaproteobacteria bacterium]|nr:MAG: hypothetical protein CM1200mP14_14760 [Gammaproteobacteria bacterium]
MSAAERLAAYQTHRSMVEESFFKNPPWQHLGPTKSVGGLLISLKGNLEVRLTRFMLLELLGALENGE